MKKKPSLAPSLLSSPWCGKSGKTCLSPESDWEWGCPIYYPLSSLSSSSASCFTSCMKWLQMDSLCLLAVLLLRFTLALGSMGAYSIVIHPVLLQPRCTISYSTRSHLNGLCECAHKSDFSARNCVYVFYGLTSARVFMCDWISEELHRHIFKLRKFLFHSVSPWLLKRASVDRSYIEWILFIDF